MAASGLMTLARVALRSGQAMLPAYRSKFSQHRFTQPQLLAILCLMRYEEWTFREAAVRVAEPRELRAALGWHRVPAYTTLYRFLRRLDAAILEQLLNAVVARLLPQASSPATVAVDATGLAPGAVSTCFVTRAKDREPGCTWRPWLKWTMAVAIDQRGILAQTARRGPYNDCATLRPRVDLARQRLPIGVVLADAEFDSERNHQYVRHVVQAYSVIPAKRGAAQWKLQGMRAQMRQELPVPLYRRRSLIESVISAVKRKLSARAPGRSLVTQCLQALLLGIADNIYRRWCFALLGIRRMSTEPNSL
jgi:Transposase DDE domain/Transposase domain (DUF772)